MNLVTKEDWHDHLVKLSMQAYDNSQKPAPIVEALETRHDRELRAKRRAQFELEARERMAQAAQVIAMRFPPR